ncbi:MAG TPA: ribonuclease P protein component [Gammaproteobacteria bacterium]
MLKPEAFSCVFRHGFRSQDALFTLLAVTNDDAPRIGLAVSRKVSPTAVGRNRIKRQVRESFRTHQGELPGLDIVVMARRDTAKAGSDRLRHSLEKHWRRLITQCDPS